MAPVILEGLRRLEYRGYDSAGIAVGGNNGAGLELRRAPGKLRNLEEVIRAASHPGHLRNRTHALGDPRAAYGGECASAS